MGMIRVLFQAPRRQCLRAILAVIAIAFCDQVAAVTGAELLKKCRMMPIPDAETSLETAIAKTACVNYVAGAVGGIEAGFDVGLGVPNPRGKHFFCGVRVNNGMLVKQVLAKLEAKPELHEVPAQIAVIQVMMESHLCRPDKK